ncbi:GNAT family acetyltransferase [Rhizobium sp. R339]|uniref:GNAT family N-acetyltransferase n=1 Tax=Rhizobium sp. R339 TaxID=1764273 RepID=UPI000B6F3BF7|nr:GNAT family N-acetyltransferase [Rhizobium sp. R339]OWV72956.1 GNAT family acetyltransferase [Rhizobium sp. R339]
MGINFWRTRVSAGTSRLVDSFEMRIADINTVDLEQLHTLSIGVGWPHRADDWQFVRELGKGVVALDEAGRVLGSAMWFPYGKEFATIGLVITSPRLQARGAGQWLMDHVLNQAPEGNWGLNATRASRRLYRSLDFTMEAVVSQCQGEASLPPEAETPPGAEIRPLGMADLAAIAALDAQAFGADRTALLKQILPSSSGLGLFRDRKIEAFSFCRRFGRGHVIGPAAAASDADAVAVIRPHVTAHAGKFLRLDTREKSGAFSDFLSHCGLAVFDTVTTMSRGRPWPEVRERRPAGTAKIYALAGHALG